MQRRDFLRWGAGAAVGSVAGGALLSRPDAGLRPMPDSAGGRIANPSTGMQAGPAYSIVPVVGDGKWVWTKPPEKTGYLEPRSYRARIGVEMRGTGDAQRVRASTPVPVQHPEQEIEDVDIETVGCEAKLHVYQSGAADLLLAASGIRAGQVIRAAAEFYLTICKHYQGFQRDQFPVEQDLPREARSHLGTSPGINSKLDEVKRLANELTEELTHPWDKALAFQKWVPANIRARIGAYTSVRAALKNRVGDCEERSSVFVALCRAVGIPARLVWVPNHNWSEMFLVDEEGQGHWIPVHTSCYPWFGWVGAHELVIQKGDRIRVPHRSRYVRLLDDWAQWIGSKPRIRWFAELEPLSEEESEDPGPGARIKDAKGEWVLVGEHPMNKHMRR